MQLFGQKRRWRSVVGFCAVSFALMGISRAQQQSVQARRHFETAELLPIAVAPGVTIADEYLNQTRAQIVTELVLTNRFDRVIEPAAAHEPARSTVTISGTVTKFVPGNRAKRALIGMGAGATKMTLHVVFTDAETGKVLIEKDVHGIVWYGGGIKVGGSASDAQKGVAKQIAKLVKSNF